MSWEGHDGPSGPDGALRVRDAWSDETCVCLRCGAWMEAASLPGWFVCRACDWFMDVQRHGSAAFVQYDAGGGCRSILPEGCLLVMEWSA